MVRYTKYDIQNTRPHRLTAQRLASAAKYASGFTLLETLIAIAILFAVMGTGFNTLAQYYFQFRIISAKYDLTSALRKAQSLAMSNQYESRYGILLATGTLTVFRGSSYASRTTDFDESITFSEALTPLGLTEVVFAQLSGRPSATGTLTITDNLRSESIIINAEGRME